MPITPYADPIPTEPTPNPFWNEMTQFVDNTFWDLWHGKGKDPMREITAKFSKNCDQMLDGDSQDVRNNLSDGLDFFAHWTVQHNMYYYPSDIDEIRGYGQDLHNAVQGFRRNGKLEVEDEMSLRYLESLLRPAFVHLGRKRNPVATEFVERLILIVNTGNDLYGEF